VSPHVDVALVRLGEITNRTFVLPVVIIFPTTRRRRRSNLLYRLYLGL
jgi:hypothetical protein